MVCQEESPSPSFLWTSDLNQDYKSFPATYEVAMDFVDISTAFVSDIQIPGEGDIMRSIVTHKDGSDAGLAMTSYKCITVTYNPKYFSSLSYVDKCTPQSTKNNRGLVESSASQCHVVERNPTYLASISYPDCETFKKEDVSSINFNDELDRDDLYQCHEAERNTLALSETDHSLVSEEFKCHLVMRNPNFLASVSILADSKVKSSEDNTDKKLDQVRSMPDPHIDHATLNSYTCHLTHRNPKFLTSMTYPIMRSDFMTKPSHEREYSPDEENETAAKDSEMYSCKVIQQDPRFVASISYPEKTGRSSSLADEAEQIDMSTTTCSKNDELTRGSGVHTCLMTQRNPTFVASISYPDSKCNVDATPAEAAVEANRKRSYIDEMQDIGRAIKEKGIEDSLVSRRLLRLTSYYLEGETERSRGGSRTTTVQRFEVEDSVTEGGSSSSCTSGSANSNSSMDATLPCPPTNGGGRKKKPKPPKSADPLTFEELGKVYTNISKREIVAKVSKCIIWVQHHVFGLFFLDCNHCCYLRKTTKNTC